MTNNNERTNVINTIIKRVQQLRTSKVKQYLNLFKLPDEVQVLRLLLKLLGTNSRTQDLSFGNYGTFSLVIVEEEFSTCKDKQSAGESQRQLPSVVFFKKGLDKYKQTIKQRVFLGQGETLDNHISEFSVVQNKMIFLLCSVQYTICYRQPLVSTVVQIKISFLLHFSIPFLILINVTIIPLIKLLSKQ